MLEVAGHLQDDTRARISGTIRERGIDVQLQIPIFDFGEVRVRQAEATYMQAVNRLTEKAVNVRSEARDAYRTYRASYDIASHYQREVLPLRKIISDESQLRFSAMQIDVFALLQEARQRIAALRAAIEAKRAFWLAKTELTVAVNGGGSGAETSHAAQPVPPPRLPPRAAIEGDAHAFSQRIYRKCRGARRCDGRERPRAGRRDPGSADDGKDGDAAADRSVVGT